MTQVKGRWLSLTDSRYLNTDTPTPLLGLSRVSSIEYRDRLGDKFLYPAAELIAAGYESVPQNLTVDAVYILRPVKSPAEL